MNQKHQATAAALALTSIFLGGCSSVTNGTGTGLSSSSGQYQAFGDFITDGATLTSPSSQAYPALVAGDEKVSLSNHANTPDQACDLAPMRLFASDTTPKSGTHPVYSVLIGTNDVDVRSSGPYEQTYRQCHLAALAWLAVPSTSKVLAGSTSFSATGPGAIDATSPWTAWTTHGQGSTVSFQITTTQTGTIYLWTVIDDDSAAAFDIALDGPVIASAYAQTSPFIATVNGTTRSLGLIRIPAVAAGRHTITLTQTNDGKDGVSALGIGAPAASSTARPTVLAGTIPYQLQTGSSTGCQSSDAPCQAYNTDIAADVNLLAGDGLDVRLFDARKYLLGTSADMADATHPNAQGQQEISQAVKAAWTAGN